MGALNRMGDSRMVDDLYWGPLKAGDWATWAGAAGSILAAAAAVAAAIIALRISNEAAARESARYARRAETHAAFMFNEVVLVHTYLGKIQSLASAMAHAGPDNTYELAVQLVGDGRKWSELIERIPLDSISELPEAFAPHTAGAISSSRMLALQADTLLQKWRGQPEDFDRLHRMGATMERRCVEISSNLKPYLDFAKERFGYEME